MEEIEEEVGEVPARFPKSRVRVVARSMISLGRRRGWWRGGRRCHLWWRRVLGRPLWRDTMERRRRGMERSWLYRAWYVEW